MKALWTQEEAEFHGEFVNFDPVWLYPKPKQKPHPPMLLGGETRPHDQARGRVLRRLVPAPARRLGAQERGGAPARRRPTAAGRDPATLSITVFAAPPIAAKLAPYREAGIDRVLFEVPDAEPRRDPARARQERGAGEGLKQSPLPTPRWREGEGV